MARGGFRPGSGRPKGAVKPGKVVRLRVIPSEGHKPGRGKLAPLQYMLGVMNDPGVDEARRDRMAIAAAPFCHPRVSDSRIGKKDELAEAAKNAGQGSGWGDDLGFDGRPN